MPSFYAPDTFSSSPPSTPDRRRRNDPFDPFSVSNPSTTPAGPPPPSSAGSFTPAGPPPSTILGSSRLDLPYDNEPLQPLNFGRAPAPLQFDSPASSPAFASFGKARGNKRSNLSNELKSPTYGDEEDMEDAYGEPDQENNMFDFRQRGSGDASINDIERMADEMNEDRYGNGRDFSGLRFDNSLPRPRDGRRDVSFGQSDFRSPESSRMGRDDDLLGFRKSMEEPGANLPEDFMFSRIAKDISIQMGLPVIDEEDDLVLGTEALITRLYRERIKTNEDERALREVLTTIPSELLSLWADYNERTKPHQSEEYATAIGPGPKASNFAHANFLASLLLSLHHPSSLEVSRPTRETLKRGSVAPSLLGQLKPIPLLLLEWMDEYHDPYPSQLDSVMNARPSPAHHRLFWNTVLNGLLRGRIVGVVAALRNAGWEHARQAVDDVRNHDLGGYSGRALENVRKVAGEMLQILQQCPAMRGDWDIGNSDWTLFRLKASQGLENLKRFAEGKDQPYEEPASFEASNFGMFSMAKSYSGTARKAESRVPWDVYQNLIAMYNLVLGDVTSIIGNSQDWCEATVGLLIWWNQSDQDRRMALSRSHVRREASGAHTYLKKLAEAFYLAISESTDFQVNPVDAMEVGLAAIFESDVEAVVGILRSFSGPVSAAVVELGSVAGWLPRPATQSQTNLNSSLDQDDMDLLGLNQPPSEQPEDLKDETLIAYADGLAEQRTFKSTPRAGHPSIVREGWEISIEVFGRLDSAERSEKEVGRMIREFPLNEGPIVDKLWRLLNELAMTSHAEHVAEEYATSLSDNTHKYGEALWYYSLAHKQGKVKDVLDLLISLSLLHSVAYPPEAELDDHLKRLISSPKAALSEISGLDYEAAKLMHKMLSGYATLRRFYSLRDEEVSSSRDEKRLVPLATKGEAASALMAVITSSDDNIRGGLYDEQRGAVVSVDFLLALLGEAMVFVDQPQYLLTPYQIDVLLKSIEDLQTVSERVYSASDEFFQTVLASTPGMKGSSPMDLLKKSTSSMSGASSFSMAGSSMIASQLQRSIGSSGALVNEHVNRGWDWRKGLTAGMTSTDVLKILRYGLAKDLARASVLEADGQL